MQDKIHFYCLEILEVLDANLEKVLHRDRITGIETWRIININSKRDRHNQDDLEDATTLSSISTYDRNL